MIQTLNLRRLAALLAALSLVVLLSVSIACSSSGGDDDDGDDGGSTPAATEPADDGGDDGGSTPAATEPADDGDDENHTGSGGEVSFDVSMGDNLFEPNEFTVPLGAEVTFNINNDGTAIHNMRVAGEDNEFNTEDDAESAPALFNAGDTGTLEWTAPHEPGEIKFQCDFHTTDMTGTITAE